MSIASDYACLINVSTNHSPFIEAAAVSEHHAMNGLYGIVDHLICMRLSLMSIKLFGVAIDPAVDGKRSRVGLEFGVGLGVLLG